MKNQMRTLVNGFKRFKREVFPAQRSLFQELTKGQHPKALFITCSDSRVVPEVITQSQPGDLFICRTVGNQVPPHGEASGHGVSSSIEYALQLLGIRQIVICGHTDCGAMHGVLHPEKLHKLPATTAWLRHTDRARAAVMANHSAEGRDGELVCRLAEENVVSQLEHLRSHPAVAEGLKRGDLDMHGWVYQLHSGDVMAYDTSSNRFLSLMDEDDERGRSRSLRQALAAGGYR
jgi:carbonic anhydrase